MVAQIDSVYKTLSLKIKLKRIVSYLGFEGRPLTTKGRFINSPLKVFYSAISFFSSASPRCNVAYVLGTGRSGTTILGVSLSAHENVGFLNEPKLPWFWSNSRDDIIGSYSCKPGNYTLTKADADAEVVRATQAVNRAKIAVDEAKTAKDKAVHAASAATAAVGTIPPDSRT